MWSKNSFRWRFLFTTVARRHIVPGIMTNFERIEAAEAQRLVDEEGHFLMMSVRSPSSTRTCRWCLQCSFQTRPNRAWFRIRFSEVVQALVADKSQGVTSCQMGGRSVRSSSRTCELNLVADLRGGFAGEKDGATGVVIVEAGRGVAFPLPADLTPSVATKP